MFRFLLGIAVGMAAATALQRNSQSSRRSAAQAAGGRVDELASAARHPVADTGPLNAGDGTGSERSASVGSGSASPSSDARTATSARTEPAIGQTSDTFNAA